MDAAEERLRGGLTGAGVGGSGRRVTLFALPALAADSYVVDEDDLVVAAAEHLFTSLGLTQPSAPPS